MSPNTPFAVGVFNIKPDHIHRNINLVHFFGHHLDIVFVVVVPPTLVVRQREQRRKHCFASHRGILAQNIFRPRSQEHEQVDDTCNMRSNKKY